MNKLYIPLESESVILNMYYDGESCTAIGKKLNLHHQTIIRFVESKGLEVINPKSIASKINRNKWGDICSQYKNGKNTYEIAKLFGVSPNSIIKILEYSGEKLRSKSERMRQYDINENFFAKIDTEEKAYILGILYADGYNGEEAGTVSLTLHQNDIELLEKINIILSSNNTIKSKKNSKCSILHIHNQKICKDLTTLGCYRKKSLTLEFPTRKQVPDHLLRHFIRGYFDGDGYIGAIDRKHLKFKTWVMEICSSRNFNTFLQSFMEDRLDIFGNLRPRGNVSIYCISGNMQAERFFDWIYKNSNLFMQRKYNKYLELKKEVSETPYKSTIRTNFKPWLENDLQNL